MRSRVKLKDGPLVGVVLKWLGPFGSCRVKSIPTQLILNTILKNCFVENYMDGNNSTNHGEFIVCGASIWMFKVDKLQPGVDR